VIHGEIVTDESYYNIYPSLLELLTKNFTVIESGIQGDAYICVKYEDELVMLDTFSSMKFQIKSNMTGGRLLEQVITVLENYYTVCIYDIPEF